MRAWGSQDNGPIRPLRINRQLAWRVAQLRRLHSAEIYHIGAIGWTLRAITLPDELSEFFA